MIKDRLIQMNIDNTAQVCNQDSGEVEKVIDLTYEFIRRTNQEADFKNMSLEEFRGAKKNFNIPGLGKFYAAEIKFKKINKLEKYDNEAHSIKG